MSMERGVVEALAKEFEAEGSRWMDLGIEERDKFKQGMARAYGLCAIRLRAALTRASPEPEGEVLAVEKLQRILDWIRYQANSEGGIGQEIRDELRRIRERTSPDGGEIACTLCGFPESRHPVDIDGPGAGQQVACPTFTTLARLHDWRDIATAPTDGTLVLAYSKDWTEDAVPARYRGWRWVDVAGDFHIKPPPTHWMPLPTPPDSENES